MIYFILFQAVIFEIHLLIILLLNFSYIYIIILYHAEYIYIMLKKINSINKFEIFIIN